METSSFWVSETGRSMSTKKSWKTRMPWLVEPRPPFLPLAEAVMRQVVMLSATVSFSSASPFLSVIKDGSNNSVSGKNSRTRTLRFLGAAGPEAPVMVAVDSRASSIFIAGSAAAIGGGAAALAARAIGRRPPPPPKPPIGAASMATSASSSSTPPGWAW